MDLDAFAHEHTPMWRRLDALSRRSRRRLTAAEVDELIMLYQRVSTHLSLVRSHGADPLLVASLSRLVLRARATITPPEGFSPAAVLRFFAVSFPLAVYRAWAWCLGVAVGSIGLAVVLAMMIINDPSIADRLLGPDAIASLVEHDFEAYYSENPPADFSTLVWLNNSLVSLIALAGGVLIVPTLVVLWNNTLNIGVTGGVMVGNGRADVFWGLITIHGLLELTCVFVAAGVGLRVGWAWIAPGRALTRTAAIAIAGRSAFTVALGLVVPLGVSGLVEAFVTPSPLPVVVKLAIGATVWLAFLVYVVAAGRAAARAEETSDVASFERDVVAPTV